MIRTITVTPSAQTATQVVEFFRATLLAWQMDDLQKNKWLMVFDELFSNIIQYSGATTVTLVCRKEPEGLSIELIDNGVPFDPLDADKVDISCPLEERIHGGFGIFIVKNNVDDMKYEYVNQTNHLTVYMKWEKEGENHGC